jgi:hypothetical protein
MKIDNGKIRIWARKGLALLSRFLFVLIGGVFKEPILFSIGVFGILLFVHTSITFIEDYTKILDPLKFIIEVFSALTAYTLYIKKNITAWINKNTFSVILETKLRDVKDKLLKNIKYELVWSVADLKTMTAMLFPAWIKRDEQLQNIESLFVDAIDTIILSKDNLSIGKRLFIQYIVYELFPLSRSKFLSRLKYSDYTEGSVSNEFFTVFDSAVKMGEKFDIKDFVTPIDKDSTKLIFDKLSTGNLAYYRSRMNNATDRNALVAVAEQCIRLGYTSIDQILRFRREQQPFKMLIKYDERFTYFDRELKVLSSSVNDEKKTEELLEKAKAILNPYPFSHALSDYEDVVIRLMPRDMFIFLFDLNLLYKKYQTKDVKRFMEQVVVPAAKSHHLQKMNSIRKLDKVFAQIKKEFTANYYIIDIDIESLIVKADNKSIPEGMKRILVQDVLANGDFAQLLTTQDLYIKKIIETMPLDALLFNAEVSQSMHDFLKASKIPIQQAFKSAGIPNNNIYEKKDFKKYINKVTDTIYQVQEKKNQRSRKMLKKDIKIAMIIVAENASKLVTILEKGITSN